MTESEVIIDFIYNSTGIVLDESKDYLIKGRLTPLLEESKASSIYDLINIAKSSRVITQKIIDAISTNETYFFRDKTPFNLLKEKLFPMVEEKSKNITIWSAAASTGQEAYSIAITADEYSNNSIKIFGTDINSSAVSRAQEGTYSSFEVKRGLTDSQTNRYFKKISNREFQISDSIKKMVQFRKGNLLKDTIFAGMYDIVFCRNVAIYFSNDDKRLLLERIHKSLKPGGFLLIGSTESITYGTDLFKRDLYNGAVYYEKIG